MARISNPTLIARLAPMPGYLLSAREHDAARDRAAERGEIFAAYTPSGDGKSTVRLDTRSLADRVRPGMSRFPKRLASDLSALCESHTGEIMDSNVELAPDRFHSRGGAAYVSSQELYATIPDDHRTAFWADVAGLIESWDPPARAKRVGRRRLT